MKKKGLLFALAALVILAVLFLPIPMGADAEAGAATYSALTYKIVKWDKEIDGGARYEKTRVYFLSDRFKSLDELWISEESERVEHQFNATIVAINADIVTVEPLQEVNGHRGRIEFSKEGLADIRADVGSLVQVYYIGGVRETYPASIDATRWNLLYDVVFYEKPVIYLYPTG